MGLLDFFKSSEEKKQQEVIDNLYKKIFPGGKAQQTNEVQEIRQLLGFRYTKEAVEKAYVFAVISYYTSTKPILNEIVEAVLRNSDISVTKVDAEKICLFIETKRYYKPKNSLKETLTQKTDGEKLFMIVFGGIVEIKKAYKDLTNEGKFEVILFNTLVALQEYQQLHEDKYQKAMETLIGEVYKQAVSYGIKMTSTEFAEFVNLRLGTFLEDIIRFFSTEPEDEGYLMLKTYTIIYEKPLVKDPKISQNIFEYLAFLPALIKMRNYTIEKVNNIF